MSLPHVSAIRNWTSSVNGEPGFLKEVLACLEQLPNDYKDCNLVLDGMAIKKQIIWDKKANKFVGFSDYGSQLDLEGNNMPATEVLVFMLINLKGKWKCPIGYFFQNKINAVTQAELIKSALSVTHNAGLRVWGITCDGAFTNFSSMKILGCKFQDISSYTELKSWINHPISNEKVFFLPDPCHMLKLARNTLGNAKVIITNKGVVKWDYIENLFKVQSDLSLKLGNKLSQAHVMWQQNKMKVKLAAQTLSSSTADALLFMKNIHMDGFHNVDETVTFCRNIDRLFDFLNSRNPFAKGYKSAIFPSNLEYLESEIIPLVDYLFTLQVKNNNDTISHIYTTSKKTFVIGFALAVKSIFSIAKLLFEENQNFKYILSYQFSQDHIEILFSRFRQRFGANNNPNVLQFKVALKQILMKNAIKYKSNGNCCNFDDDVFGALLEFKWSKKKDICNIGNVDEIDEEVLNRSILLNSTNSIVDDAKSNILYYITGYVVKKVSQHIDCDSCIVSLMSPHFREHNYHLPPIYSKLTSIKNQGGLIFSSDCSFKIILAVEHFFLLLTDNLKNINIPNLENKIIALVNNKFVLDRNIFKTLDCENVCLSDRPHKMLLITLLVKKFLSVRLHSYGKLYSSDILNPVSKRQKLTKTILFYNQ